MKINIYGKNFKLTEPLKKNIERKIFNLIKFNNKIVKVKINIEADTNQRGGQIHLVEIWLLLQQKSIKMLAKAGDVYEAVNNATNRLERLLVKQKERGRQKQRQTKKDFLG